MSLQQRPWKTLVLGCVLAVLAGCGGAPVQEMSDARQAIRAARIAGGERYTPQTLTEAEQLIAQARRELSAGDFRRARRTALSAKQRAVWARQASLAVQSPD